VNQPEQTDAAPGTPSAQVTQLLCLLRDAVPLIDLRAPGEFARGSVPSAINLPILSDTERADVGTTYKNSGQAAAIELGNRLVSGAVRDARLKAWRDFLTRHPDARLFCWRGGLRSETAQQWLKAAGVSAPRVAGGYKALRNACLDALGSATTTKRWVVVGGRTGSGKTLLLQRTPLAIDLEGLANHRGSAFGARDTPQPETQSAELIILETDMASRCANIRREYVDEPLQQGLPEADLAQRIEDALDRIARRLGGARHTEVKRLLAEAFDNGNHSAWIERLLSWYYDPMYDYQLEKKHQRVTLTGDADTLLNYLNSELQPLG
jgi:tRNA 2-selenouridine synthase